MPSSRRTLLVAVIAALGLSLAVPPASAGALNRALSREMAARIAARQTMTAAERQALVRILRDLDVRTLRVLEARFGNYIPRETLALVRQKPVTFLDDAAFKDWVRQADPTLTPQEISAIRGATNEMTRNATVDRNQITLARSVAHERVHQLSNRGFRLRFGDDFNEGVTDYFAARVTSDLNIPDAAVGYPAQRELAGMLTSRVGDGPLAQAYFRNDLDTLARSLDQQLGPGSFAAFQRYLQRQEFASARALLLGARP